MKKGNSNKIFAYVCIFFMHLFFVPDNLIYSANFPLQIINIKPVGTQSITSKNRIFRAYPGIEYNIKPAVIGGTYPFTYAITANKPSWLNIDNTIGTISGIAPSSGTFNNITVTVTDGEGGVASATWSITVTTTDFVFIDSVTGSDTTGTGAIGSPYKTMAPIYGTWQGGTNPNGNKILYFRSGTHVLYDNRFGDSGKRYGLSLWTGDPLIWLAYPGENVTIDMNDKAIDFRQRVRETWIDGFSITNMTEYGIRAQTPPDYMTVRRCDWNNMTSTQTTNNNYGIISLWDGDGTDGTRGYYVTIQDNKFHNFTNTVALGSIYNITYLLIEGNEIYDSYLGANVELSAGISIKAITKMTFIRGNYLHNMGSNWMMGDDQTGVMHLIDTTDISFNRFIGTSDTSGAIVFNDHGCMYKAYFYRNTVRGRVLLKWFDAASAGNPHADSFNPNGPLYIYNNVIINNATSDQNHLSYSSVGSNLTGQVIISGTGLSGTTANSIIDSVGILTGSYTSYIGTIGYQTSSAIISTVPKIPNVPIILEPR